MVKMTLELTSEQLARLQTSVLSDKQRRLENITEIEKRLEYWRAQKDAASLLAEDESNLEFARARVVIADDLLKLLGSAGRVSHEHQNQILGKADSQSGL